MRQSIDEFLPYDEEPEEDPEEDDYSASGMKVNSWSDKHYVTSVQVRVLEEDRDIDRVIITTTRIDWSIPEPDRRTWKEG